MGDTETFRDHKANCHTRLTAKRNAAAKEQAWINLYRLVNGPDLQLPSTPYTNHWAWIG
ncbi:hypothetical protein IQ07DRAFT_586967 [Pyrenochaeta sp. DS3sAY3a]|nr:hypothetical protein IQ07DRAFT_586967 [Pyrenochaeta sp. DS3sAY3a]